MSGYLPPVVIQVIGDDAEFLRMITKDQGLLKDFGKSEAQAKVGADDAPFASKLTAAKTELLQFAKDVSNAHLGADAAPFWSDITKLRAELAAMSSLDIRVDADVAAAAAKIDALRGSLALSQVGTMIPAAGGSGGGGGFLAGLLAGRGGGGKGPGLASLLGFGAAAGFGGLAGIGTLGSFAGLGMEHLLMTGIGLAGSAAGGMLGGGLLGLGSLGVMGVGMGTDMAGMGQAANDAKKYSAALDNLNQAIAVYGPKSRQAAQATAQLKYVLSGMPTAAQGAIVALVNTTNQFKDMFDQLTGPAEKIGAQILTQAVQVGEKFLPTIGKFAAENMGIIRQSLQPLFAYLQGPGLTIFTNLETKFQQDLPTAMDAFDQGVELLMGTLNLIAPQTGGLIKTLDRLFTYFNSTSGWMTWSNTIEHLIGDFRNWEGLIKIVGEDIFQLFHADAGTATSIVTSLTQMLTKLHEWETSTQGQAQMHNLFETHKQEILQILKLLPTLLSTFGRIEMAVAPQMTTLATDVLKVVNALLKIPDVGPLIAWAGAIAVVGSKLKLLSIASTLVGGIKSVTGALRDLSTVLPALLSHQTSLGSMFSAFGGGGGLSGMASAARNAARETEGLDGALARTSTALSGAPQLWVPMSARMSETAGAAEKVAGGVESAAGNIGGLAGPIGLAAGLLTGSLVPAFMALFHHGPSAAQQTAQAVQQLNQQLSQLQTGTVLQMGISLDSINTQMQNLSKSMSGLKQGSTGMDIANAKMTDLAATSIGITSDMVTMNSNVTTLAKTFGISQGDVQSFANEIGLNLKGSLDPTQLKIFGQAVQQSGTDFNKAAMAPPKWADQVAQSAARAVQAAKNANATLNADAQTASALHTLILQGMGVQGIAAFVNGQKGGLWQVEAVAKRYGIAIPQQYLDVLNKNMLTGGLVSMNSLTAGLAQNLPEFAATMGKIPSTAVLALGNLPADAFSFGAQVDSGLAAGIQANVQQVLNVTASVAAGVVGAMRKGLQTNSPSRVMMEIGQNVGEGLAVGIAQSQRLVASAAVDLARAAIAPMPGALAPSLRLAGSAGGLAASSATTVVHVHQGNILVQGGSPAQTGVLARQGQEEANRQLIAALRSGKAV